MSRFPTLEGAPAPKRRKREEALVEQSCDVEVPLAKRTEERIQALRATLSRLKIDAPEMSGFMEYAYAAHGHGMMSDAHLLRSWEVFIDAMGRRAAASLVREARCHGRLSHCVSHPDPR